MTDSDGRHQLPGDAHYVENTVKGFDLSNPFAALCARALGATGVPAFVTGAYADGMPVQWVNSAFVAYTGFMASDLAGSTTGFLSGLLGGSSDADRLRDVLGRGEAIEETLRLARQDGTSIWSRLHLSPIREPNGAVDHWVGVQMDVSEHVEQCSAQLASLAAEREEKLVLDIFAHGSDLLTDLDQPDALGQIAALLSGTLVSWCGFYLNDDGLRFAVGVDAAAPPSGRGQRHGRFAAGMPTKLSGIPRATGEIDALGDLRVSALHGTQTQGVLPDQVQDLLDGTILGPVTLRLGVGYPQYSASGWLSRDLHHRFGQDRPAAVSVHAIPGRRSILGLLVADPRPAAPSQTAADDASAPATPPPLTPERIDTLLQVLGRRVGSAIDNVRLYAREHKLAETLQRAMLPEQAEIPGLDVWTYYAPNSEHAQVGGDWYDVLQIGPEAVGLVIGDVVGHDVEAAAAMGQLRSVVRSYAYELGTPGPVLERVDQLVQGMRIPRSASLAYVALTRPADGETTWSAQYSRAGHLPPLLLRHHEVTLLDDAGGALIGFGGRSRHTGTADLKPGDALLLYTDGLIERRDRSLRAGLDALIAAAGAITAIDAAGIGEELLSSLADAPEDDVALVVVRIPDPATDADTTALSPRSRRWVLPSEPASIGKARHAVVRTCQAWGLQDSANAELVISELVANGVLHGWGHLALRLFDTPEGLRIEVEDSNPAPPVTADGHAHRMGGFGMQIVERLAEWGWFPQGSGKVVWAVLHSTATRQLPALRPRSPRG